MSTSAFFVTAADLVDLPDVADLSSLYAAERDYFSDHPETGMFIRRLTAIEADASAVCGACLVARSEDESGLKHIYGDIDGTFGGTSAGGTDRHKSPPSRVDEIEAFIDAY